MKDRIILTEAQLEALKLTKAWGRQASIVGYVAKGQHIPNSQYQPLEKLTLEQLLRVFYEPNSYELGPVYKDGDKIYYYKDHMDGRYKGIYTVKKQVDDTVETYEKGYDGVHFGLVNIRHATPEDFQSVKNEKERQMWEKIGREVGEFKLGDVVIKSNGETVTVRNIDGAKHHYKMGSRKGFFPVESFINYEEELK